MHLLLEPGRSIVGPAGVLLTRVLYRKTNNRKRFLIVDAAMNDLVRPSLYGAYHEIVPVSRGARETEITDVVGPICETGDFFARDRRLPLVSEGGLLAILDTGAYGSVLGSNYNTRGRSSRSARGWNKGPGNSAPRNSRGPVESRNALAIHYGACRANALQ